MTAVRQEVRGQKDDLVMLQCLLVIAKKLEKEWQRCQRIPRECVLKDK